MVSASLARIQDELQSIGYRTELQSSPQGQTVVFSYKVEAGTHSGATVMLGISMQGSELYPEYPPHWVHISPAIDDRKGGAVSHYTDDSGREWIAMSRPPGGLWDRLPTKSMHAYLSEHLRRLWVNM